MSSSNEILVFWFGKNLVDLQVISEKSSLWWGKDEAIDAQINLHFGPLLKNLRSSEFDKWKDSPETLLAKVILTDQFSRNIHRDTPDAFSKDVLALELCTQGVNSGMDKKLRPIQRVFFYMPLEHSEAIECQNRSVELFEKLLHEVDDGLKEKFQGYVEYAERHRSIVLQFGRFPHRNKILNRASTLEEIEFLQLPNSSF